MTGRDWASLAAAGLVIHLALALPDAPVPGGQAWLRVAPELPLILLALPLSGRIGRIATAVLLVLLTAQKTADWAMNAALGRPFNVLADLPLLAPGAELARETLGLSGLLAGLAATLALGAAAGAALWWATGQWSRHPLPPAMAIGLAAAGGAFTATALAGAAWAGNGPYAAARLALFQQTARDLRQMRALAARDELAGTAGLLAAIDRDVLVIFVESYGRASFDVPFHADRHRATLEQAQPRLAQAGLAMRSGFLVAPTQGGQSWLSHATLANGLWIADQTRYRTALVSGRQGLFHHARQAGFRTAAVMPAITRPWPEAATMGFDHILAAGDLGYRGLPFNWVTMPDQFTLAATDRLLRDRTGPPHLFAQVALISSHAPWVPAARLLDWNRLGNGAVFDAMARAGDPPEVVWRDRDRVRHAYRDAVDYSLRTVLDYARLHAADPPLMIVLGDHQAVPWVAGQDVPDVPVHLIGPPHLVDRAASWGLAPGLVPPIGHEALPMDQMRNLILRGFGTLPPHR
ncbi:sulfatase [Paracoccus subflavus]|uniref:Sulfatase n=1 Tax=Paracoccus subflavus TaxID=2528244 RepID=A0A4Q9FYI4_9RHOB|nr:sulfatase [Paracoccus subflavus]TBN39104.1 sulfatase [Paracoccus subflavus]